jgi:hypothetical protein
MVGTDTQLIADLSALELAREESWWVWLNPFVLYDVIDLRRLKLYLALRNGFVHPPEETISDWVEKARWYKREDKKVRDCHRRTPPLLLPPAVVLQRCVRSKGTRNVFFTEALAPVGGNML